MYAICLKRESSRNKKWNLVRMCLKHTTLALLVPRSTNWAKGPFDTNILRINSFYEMNIRSLFKKRK